MYGQYRMPITNRLSADLGLRAEHVTYDYDNFMQSGRTRDDGSECGFGGCRYNRPDSREDSFTNLSPKLALHFELGSHHLFANLSQGFRAPQAAELYRLQGGQSVVDIDSESLNAIELGVRGASPKLRYQVAAFAMKKEQFIFKDTDRANVDNGQTRHHGLEVEAQLALNESFDIELNWAFARHRYDNNPALARSPIEGNDIDTAPRSFGGIRLNWRLTPSINTQLEWVHLGEYFTNPENSNTYDGHDLLNLRGQLALSDEWQVFFRVTNLSDTDYAERADFAFGRERFFVGEPRSVYIGIRGSR
jgi:outer membrane receptor protein involved in Fe transport